MRNFRKAALAGATAVAVAFGSTAVATAQTPTTDSTPTTTTAAPNPSRPITEKDGNADAPANSSTRIGKKLGAYDNGQLQGADGRAIFGKEQVSPNGDFRDQPQWAQLMFAGSIFAAVAAVVGLIVGPLYNFIVHGPVNL